MNKAKKVALGGIFTALCFVVLFLGSLFQSLDLSSAAFGSIIILIAFIELGKKWAFGIYAASSLLSTVLLPNKSSAVIFLLFAGFYPIMKEWLNRIKPRWLSYLTRIVSFNIVFSLIYFISTRFLGFEKDPMLLGIALYALANITFIAYDFAIERIAFTYVSRIKPLFFRNR